MLETLGLRPLKQDCFRLARVLWWLKQSVVVHLPLQVTFILVILLVRRLLSSCRRPVGYNKASAQPGLCHSRAAV